MQADTSPLKTLHLELRPGDVLTLSSGVTMVVQFKRGHVSRVTVRAPEWEVIKKIPATRQLTAPSPAN